jgi:hypothetical protein
VRPAAGTNTVLKVQQCVPGGIRTTFLADMKSLRVTRCALSVRDTLQVPDSSQRQVMSMAELEPWPTRLQQPMTLTDCSSATCLILPRQVRSSATTPAPHPQLQVHGLCYSLQQQQQRLATGDWRLATSDWRLATGD